MPLTMLTPHKSGRCAVPVVDFIGGWEAFCGPVEETVKKDEAGETGPPPHDRPEGEACVVDELGGGRDRW